MSYEADLDEVVRNFGKVMRDPNKSELLRSALDETGRQMIKAAREGQVAGPYWKNGIDAKDNNYVYGTSGDLVCTTGADLPGAGYLEASNDAKHIARIGSPILVREIGRWLQSVASAWDDDERSVNMVDKLFAVRIAGFYNQELSV